MLPNFKEVLLCTHKMERHSWQMKIYYTRFWLI